jgi:hypothetical protein
MMVALENRTQDRRILTLSMGLLAPHCAMHLYAGQTIPRDCGGASCTQKK